MGKSDRHSAENHEKRKWQQKIERKQSQTEGLRHQLKKACNSPMAAIEEGPLSLIARGISVQVRHELHKVRERAREVAENQKFEVQRTIASFRQQENDSSQELQKCQALRAAKDLELSSLRDQMAQQQQRAREQRAELEVEFEAKLGPLREGAPHARADTNQQGARSRRRPFSRKLARASEVAR